MTYLKPCPPHGGELIRCYNLIDSLSRHFKVVVLAPEIKDACELVKKAQAWRNLPDHEQSPLAQIVHVLRPHAAWQQALRTTCQKHTPQATLFDYGHWGHYAHIPPRLGSKTIMIAHNAQADLSRQACNTRPIGRWHVLYLLRYWAERRHENRLFHRFDRIISPSEANRRYHARFVGDQRSWTVPNYVNQAWYTSDQTLTRADNSVVITGNFRGFQNRYGLIWFLKQVWPQVRRQVPQVQLELVGKGTETLTRVVKGQENVRCIGQVPSVVPYLRQATIAAIPLLHGSGVRFKILEALACEIPVVSTSLGAEGLDLVSEKNAILADSGEAFAQAIVSLLQDKQKQTTLAQHGSSLLTKKYSFDVNTQRLQNLVLELITS